MYLTNKDVERNRQSANYFFFPTHKGNKYKYENLIQQFHLIAFFILQYESEK